VFVIDFTENFGALEAKSDLNDEHNTVTAPEQSGAAAFSEPSRTCKTCGATKPLCKYPPSRSTRDGRKAHCYTCVGKRPSHKESIRRWQKRHPEQWKAMLKRSADKLKAKRLQSRPAKTPCQCGNESDFRWHQNAWACTPCCRIKSKARKKLENEKWQASKRYKYLLKAHGEQIANAYMQIADTGFRINVPMWKIIRMAMPPAYHRFSKHVMARVHKLNALAGLPRWNSGWSCSKCGEASHDPRFFDLDHIQPRHKSGNGRRQNLQILCPNCHRRKTILDLRGSGEITANELGASTPNRVDATSLINNPNPGKPGQCGEPGRLDSNLLTA